MKKILALSTVLLFLLTSCGEKDTETPSLIVSTPIIEIETGDEFNPLSYATAIDNIDGDITPYITVNPAI